MATESDARQNGAPGQGAAAPTGNPQPAEGSEEDVMSDPALDDHLGSDWVDEGGATPAGPATSTPGPVETEESKQHVRFDPEHDEDTTQESGDEEE